MVAGYDCFEDSLNVRKRIGYLPERVPLYDDMKACDYLDLCGGDKGCCRPRKSKHESAGVMDDFGLNEVSNRDDQHTLQRISDKEMGLAQAVVNEPEVLILDEPTVGLDPKQIKDIRKLIKELAGKRTVILSTHILPEVSLLCGRVIIINKGKLVAVDKTGESRVHGVAARMFLANPTAALPEIESGACPARWGIKGVERAANHLSRAPMRFIVELEDETTYKTKPSLHDCSKATGSFWKCAQWRRASRTSSSSWLPKKRHECMNFRSVSLIFKRELQVVLQLS